MPNTEIERGSQAWRLIAVERGTLQMRSNHALCLSSKPWHSVIASAGEMKRSRCVMRQLEAMKRGIVWPIWLTGILAASASNRKLASIMLRINVDKTACDPSGTPKILTPFFVGRR